MAQGLHLSQKMALSQVLAPQLQQSLALLQAPTLELKALVEQELQQNPVLEESLTTEPEQENKTQENSQADTSHTSAVSPRASRINHPWNAVAPWERLRKPCRIA